MHKRLATVSINLETLRGFSGKNALASSGNNFGNMLFSKAAYRHLEGAEFVGFNFDPDYVKQNYDAILIPAANWINAKDDWGDLAIKLEQAGLPIITIGLGAQLSSLREVRNMHPGTVRLIKVIAAQSESIGVRGSFTAEVLAALKVRNVEVLGCPSIFYACKEPRLRTDWHDRLSRIAIGPTRYVLHGINDSNKYDKQRQLYQFGIRHASSFYYQSEAFEISLLSREDVTDYMDAACKYYGIRDPSDLRAALLDKGKYHTDVDQWISDITRDDLYVGTRVHGAIAALLGGTPSILITHDNRTKEMAELMGIPSMAIEEFEIAMLYDVYDFVNGLNFSSLDTMSHRNKNAFKAFYARNNVTHRLT